MANSGHYTEGQSSKRGDQGAEKNCKNVPCLKVKQVGTKSAWKMADCQHSCILDNPSTAKPAPLRPATNLTDNIQKDLQDTSLTREALTEKVGVEVWPHVRVFD